MKNDVEQNCIEFHNRADEMFFSLCNEFVHSVELLDRQKDENVFQQLQGKYGFQLKQRLQYIAGDIINTAGEGVRMSELNLALSHCIEEYEKEFMQKAKSL